MNQPGHYHSIHMLVSFIIWVSENFIFVNYFLQFDKLKRGYHKLQHKQFKETQPGVPAECSDLTRCFKKVEVKGFHVSIIDCSEDGLAKENLPKENPRQTITLQIRASLMMSY